MQWPWKKAETGLERELRFHLDSLAEAFERQGMTRSDAMQRARREFGGVDKYTEAARDERRWQPLARLGQDLTFGLRMLRKAPVVTAAAVLSLALGIGATTAILSLVDAVLWRSLPVPHPGQLTEILWQSKGRPRGIYRGASGGGFPDGPLYVADYFSLAGFETMRARAAGRANVAAHMFPTDVSTAFEGATAVAKLRAVSGNYFAVLAAPPALGRLLAPSDDEASAPAAVVVTHRFWQAALRGDQRAPGRLLRVNNQPHVIAGVLPAGLGDIGVGEPVDLYVALRHHPELQDAEGWLRREFSNPRTWAFQLLARRAPGVSSEALRPVLDAAFRASWASPPEKAETAPAIRLQDAAGGLGSIRRDLGNPLRVLGTLVALVLLIACANIANLLLARADARRKEVALRVSLGCGRARLVRQFFTESALLAALGGLLSLGVAYATANFAVSLMPGELRLPFLLDAWTLLATLAVTAATALVFGLYPAWRASNVNAAPAFWTFKSPRSTV